MRLTAVLVGLLMAPLTSLFNAKAMSTIWSWFVARDYGVGPSEAAWFGLSSILSVALIPIFLGLKGQEDDSNAGPIAKVVIRHIVIWVILLIGLGMSWLTGQAFSWI